MIKVDINSDLGEIEENIEKGIDELILMQISSANIACGYHAGNMHTMTMSVKTAKKFNTAIGAHPSFPDKEGFGRREMHMSSKEIISCVSTQILALQAICNAEGIKLQHVKPHGALYNLAVKDKETADAICKGINQTDSSLILLAPVYSQMTEAAVRNGLKYACEVFADRSYNDDGSLVSRSLPNAVITEKTEVINRVLQMVLKGTVNTITGNTIPVKADSICVHGDNPSAAELTAAIRKALTENRVCIVPLNEII